MRASTFSRDEAMARYVTVALAVVRQRGGAATAAEVAVAGGQTDVDKQGSFPSDSGDSTPAAKEERESGRRSSSSPPISQEKEIEKLRERTRVLEE